MTEAWNHWQNLNRRKMLQRCGMGLGSLGLMGLLRDQGLLGAPEENAFNPLAARQPHFKPAAKSVIWLFINGGPSQVDTWDYKPELARHHGKPLKGFDKFTGFFSGAVGGLMKRAGE